MKKKRSTPIDSKTNMKRGIWRHVKCKERKNIYIYIYIYIYKRGARAKRQSDMEIKI